MGVFYMTYITLDIIWGVGWWILKKTKTGVDSLISPKKTHLTDRKDYSKEVYDQLEDQKKQIVTLTTKIDIISNYFETLSVKR
tara:strand:+ start:50 stop:298 length:249 start_codon:yes stop_codon:yes gene_type:complete